MQQVPTTDDILPHEVPLPKDDPMQGHTRGTRFNECLQTVTGMFDKKLINYKLYYFFFFAAFGSLFALIAVYFKQLGMNATQVGLLIGIRHLVDLFASPFWCGLSEKWKRGKLIFMLSTLSWIVFTVIIGLVTPNPVGCLVEGMNDTNKHEVIQTRTAGRKWDDRKELIKSPREQFPEYVGQNPILLDKATGEPGNLIPRFSNIVYSQADVNKIFIILIFLMLIGEFTAAPAISLADIATETAIVGTPENYNKQRMFGSVGWGISMFIMGIALDLSTFHPNHPCKPWFREKNYVICFASFTILMSIALIVSTQLHFDYEHSSGEHMYFKIVKDKFRDSVLGRGRNMKNRGKLNEDGQTYAQDDFDDDGMKGTDEEILEKQLGIHGLKQPPPSSRPAVSDPDATLSPYSLEGSTWQFLVWLRVLPLFLNPKLAAFLFITFLSGVANGLVFTFLFWHLQDIGGSPTLFGIASVINHISEIVAYNYSDKLINTIGHIRVLYLVMFANICRFLYVSWLSTPAWVLPFEFIQGLTHSCAWAAVGSYIAQNIPPDARSPCQGLLQAVHGCLGKGLGSVFGGIITSNSGSGLMFRVYSVVCTVFLIFFVAMNYYFRESKLQQVPPGAQEDHDKDEEPEGYYAGGGDTGFLAPHGVPMAPHRESSSHKLNEQAQYGYQTAPSFAGTGMQQQQPMGNNQQYDYNYQQHEQQPMGGGQVYSATMSNQQPVQPFAQKAVSNVPTQFQTGYGY